MMSALTICTLLMIACATHHVNAAALPEDIHQAIYGGMPLKIIQAPYMALYRRKNYGFGCGGSIIHERFILSAAHCVADRPENMRITVGTDHAAVGGVDYSIERAIIHPKYNRVSLDYDIVVVKLQNKLKFNLQVQPITMANKNLKLPVGSVLKSMGFGSTGNNVGSYNLLQVEMQLMDLNSCRVLNPLVTDRMICAGYQVKKQNCPGDSGGPVVYNNILVGAVSWLLGECGSTYPNGYASVSSMRDFIDGVIKIEAI